MISLDFKLDKWKHLRQGLFRNKELEVELAGITTPVGRFKDIVTPETFPAFCARHSRESLGGVERDRELNRRLIRQKPMHGTPLQAVQFNFEISGITKTLQTQFVRHKIGVGWVFRSTRYVSAEENKFIYNIYDYLDDEETVKKLLSLDEEDFKRAIERFNSKKGLGATKEDARKSSMVLSYNTPCSFFANARAMRHLFILRLDKAAEWEIRRLTKVLLNICMEQTPSLFEDIAAGENVFDEEA